MSNNPSKTNKSKKNAKVSPSSQRDTSNHQRLTPKLLESRVRTLMNAPSTESRPAGIALTSNSGKGTLEQIGHEADQAWNGVKRIMALLNTEMKHVYYAAEAANVSWNGTVTDLTSLIAQGVGGNQRIGDSLKIKKVHLKFTFLFNPSALHRCTGTFVLGMSKDSLPAAADVFAVTGAICAGLAYPADTYEKADHWIKYKTLTVDQYSPAATFELTHEFNHDVLYTNGATTVASGDVWVAFVSNENINYPFVDWAVDVAFLDN